MIIANQGSDWAIEFGAKLDGVAVDAHEVAKRRRCREQSGRCERQNENPLHRECQSNRAWDQPGLGKQHQQHCENVCRSDEITKAETSANEPSPARKGVSEEEHCHAERGERYGSPGYNVAVRYPLNVRNTEEISGKTYADPNEGDQNRDDTEDQKTRRIRNWRGVNRALFV